MLELYLMGLVPADAVAAHQVLTDPRNFRFSDAGDLILEAELDTVTIAEVIENEGPRVPDHADSPKAFKMATVVVSDRPLSALELSYFEHQAEMFGSDRNSPSGFAAATGFRATMDTRLEGTTTAVMAKTDAADREGPVIAELAQNYPNPFNGNTIFSYNLPTVGDASETSLEIFSVNGQRVRRMPLRAAGSRSGQLVWDGTDDRGRLLATGVYLVVLRTADTITTRKLTLVR